MVQVYLFFFNQPANGYFDPIVFVLVSMLVLYD